MISIPFDVNDQLLREAFFDHLFHRAVGNLHEEDQALWGGMSAQHMVEHLEWAIGLSVAMTNVECKTPPQLLERAKRFLHDNRPTPHEFRNPLLGEKPPEYRFGSLEEAKAALQKATTSFLHHFIEHPQAVHVHPVFGPLGAEEWERAHFKHCYHHLLQFRLVSAVGGAGA
jgi:oxepin-CoA hydrolase/3-oxo-5,6-dehydrosuberyl-CoA semialdehyde dehydrogenase